MVEARTIQEIKQSGNLTIATREKETVYEVKGLNVIQGLHYQLIQNFAKDLGVSTKYNFVQKISDYFKLDTNQVPELFKTVDIYADNISQTTEREGKVFFIPLYKNVEVVLQKKGLSLNKIKDLAKYKTSLAVGSTYETIFNLIEKQAGVTLNKISVEKSSQQLDDLLVNKTQYTILDLDQAIVAVKKNINLEINLELLESANLQGSEICWAISPSDILLARTISTYLENSHQSGAFNQIWKDTYGMPFELFNSVLGIASGSWNKVYRESLIEYEKKQYPNALKALTSLLAIKNYSIKLEKIDNHKDRIFFSWLNEETKTEEGKPFPIIDQFLDLEPSTKSLSELKKDYYLILGDYVRVTKSLRTELIKTKKTNNVPILTKRLSYFGNPDFEEETKPEDLSSNELVLKTKKESDKNLFDSEPLMPLTVKPKNTTNIVFEVKRTEADIAALEGEGYFLSATKELNENKFAEALDHFGKCIVLNYKVTEAQKKIDEIRGLIQKREEALAKQKTEQFDLNFKKVIDDFLGNRFVAAQESLIKCLELFPENPIAQRYYELISDRLKLEGEKRISEESPYFSFFQIQMSKAENFLSKSDITNARRVYEDFLSVFPHNEFAKEKLTYCLLKLNPAEFSKYYDENLKSAKLYLSQNNSEEALKIFNFLNQIKPQQAEILKYIEELTPKEPVVVEVVVPFKRDEKLKEAFVLFQKNDLASSLKSYREVLKYFPNDATALLSSSRIENELNARVQQQSRTVAVAATQTVTSDSDDAKRRNAENYYLKGKYYFRSHDYENARLFWEKSYQIDPSYQKVLIDLKRLEKLVQ